MNSFEDFGLSQELLGNIKKLGIDRPTQIQEKSIPVIISGKDVVGESATGSGKTLAFGCGIIEKVIPKEGLQALVLTPTRELAEQVKNSIKSLSIKKNLNVISIYGGVSINPQINELTRAEVVIATTGRLLDHHQRRTINLSKLKIVVLDEADRMLDMGFIKDVEQILRLCPAKRQTLFFSATISPDIKRLADKYMIQPIQVFAKNMVDPEKLKQVYYNIPKEVKLSLLIDLLQNERSGLVMIFCNTRRTTDFVVKNLRKNEINATAIHGGLSQNNRTKTISMFNDAKVNVLVCTDVASRGLHIDNVSHIYNYEIPNDPKDYIHRIGRTARAGEEGIVVNLLSEEDYGRFSRIRSDYSNFSIKRLEKTDFKRIFAVRAESEERPRFGQRRSGESQRGRNNYSNRRR